MNKIEKFVFILLKTKSLFWEIFNNLKSLKVIEFNSTKYGL